MKHSPVHQVLAHVNNNELVLATADMFLFLFTTEKLDSAFT